MTEIFFPLHTHNSHLSFDVVCVAWVRMERVFCILYFIFRFLSLHVLYVMWHLAFHFFPLLLSFTFSAIDGRSWQQQMHWHYFSLSRKTIMQDMWFHYMQTVDKLQIFIASLCNSFFLDEPRQSAFSFFFHSCWPQRNLCFFFFSPRLCHFLFTEYFFFASLFHRNWPA